MLPSVHDDILRQRSRPRIFLLNEKFEVEYGDVVYDKSAVTTAMLGVTHSMHRASNVIFDGIPFSARVIPLVGASTNLRYAVIFERCSAREPLHDAFDRYRLTPREIDVLSLVVEGMANRSIAETLCISTATVHEHIRNLCIKIGSRRRRDLLARVFNAIEV